MPKKTTTGLFLLILLCASLAFTQENLNFEKVQDGMPNIWRNFGNESYTLGIDSEESYEGKYAATIEYRGEKPDFRAFSNSIAAKYAGKRIKLTGYIKTEGVSDGWAGLWMRLDPRMGFDNMENRGIRGTTDWTKYEVELDLRPEGTQEIVFGALLIGKGKIWIDKLSLSIDGVDIKDAKLKELKPAEKDKAFVDGSKVNFPDLDERLQDNLALMGRIWGFLKYHHPALGTGDYNWDFELFRILPIYLKAETNADRDKVLMDWIDKYGEVELCDACEEYDENAFIKADHRWISKSDMSEELQEKLLFILSNRHQGQHYYIDLFPNIGNPQFRHEAAYLNMSFPDPGFRLLALYRYWNIIHYFFPYKHLMDEDWDRKLKEYIPTFLSAKEEQDYELAMVSLIGDIQDTHANLYGAGSNKLNELKGANYSPVYNRIIEGKLVVCDYYNEKLREEGGLKEGDVITRINGRLVEEILEEKKAYYPASNTPTQEDNIAREILRSNDTSVKISYIRDSEEKSMTLPLYGFAELDFMTWYRGGKEKSYRMLENNIGYVTLRSINQEDIPKIKEEFRDTKGIIIDIRNYPKTFVPFLLGSYFMKEETPFVKFTQGNVNKPGEFTFAKEISIPASENPYQGKLMVLLDSRSISQSEYTSMAFRAGPNTTIVGSTTAGADGNISRITLPGGLGTNISGIGVYYPDGTETQRVGIVPDVVVEPTIKGIKEGRDEVLEKAIELILEK